MSNSNDKTVSRIEKDTSINIFENPNYSTDNSCSQNSMVQKMESEDKKVKFNNALETDVKENNFICKKCLSVPLIEKLQDLYITVSCDHLVLPDIYPSEFYENFTDKDNELDGIIITKELKCIKHDEEYSYYDTDCEINLCDKCIALINDHKSDTKLNFDAYDIIFKKQYIEKNLKEIMKKKHEKVKQDNIRDELIKLDKIIKTIVNAYKKYPCYKHYQNIEHIYNYLKREKNKIELLKIKNKTELIDNFDNIGNILSIKINGQSFNLGKTLSKWKDFKEPENKFVWNNLKELDLGKNKLKNIKPLLRFEFPILEKLDLSVNFLGDELIKDIGKLNCPELKDLNLYKVHLENYSIFDKMKHFKKLEKLFIGLNKFSKGRIQDINDKTKYDLSSLKTIGLTKIWSDSNGVKDLQFFKFKYLEEIYLSGNNIDSISDIKLDCNALLIKIFWLSNNNLKEFLQLEKYIYLEDLGLSDNQINSLVNFDSFLSQLIYLKKLNIENNQIDYNLQDNKNAIEKAKEEYKDMKIKY